ncbi:MAG: HAMP domain-containing protein [Actinobacteria bacterium]|nr:HAMP domain-containing protein [Actinomycetota bacterium]
MLLALIALGVPLALSLRDRVNSEVRGQAQSQAQVVATSAAELIEPPRVRVLDRLAGNSAESVRGRVIVVNSAGRLLADSAGEPVGTSYADRPEVRSALRGHGEQITRPSETLGTEILATSVPVFEHGRPRGAVRITQSVAAVNRAVRSSILDVAALAAIVLAMGLVVGWLIAAQIARPIRRLDRTARRVAGGDLEVEAVVEGSTEQRSLARTFNEMTGRVRRLLRVQQDFVADASHQLRTPLTGLRLRLEALGERFRDDPPVEAEVEAAMAEIDRLSHMVDELLILSRAGEHDVPGEQVDLADVARRAAERWGATAAQRGVGLELGRDGDGATGWIAPPDLDRALDALVENALLYSPGGSTVTIDSAPGEIAVLDRGPGLTAGEEEAVFERFRRGSAGQGGPTGTGLGLAIARELARQWDGDVTLTPRDGGGLRATIEFAR